VKNLVASSTWPLGFVHLCKSSFHPRTGEKAPEGGWDIAVLLL